jgi:Fe-S-cluster-containing dehydrogenase component/formate-dependent nitrite reductase membrane component NrfD
LRYGFVIDNRKCIGCHACSTACKSENEVPVGVNRTWVKYTETGLYPDTRRHFQVTRCNHCENPPCVRICPVTAMYQRQDGIVEFDPDVCIGCKACIQACPYDAIYIDPDTGTAAKCHYCAHRTDIGLEPACVVVCPEHAIIAGDMDDPTSEISRYLGHESVTVRKPEQGTSPKLFYVDGHAPSMHPTAAEQTPDQFMFTDPLDPAHAPEKSGQKKAPAQAAASSGTPIFRSDKQGLPATGPLQIGGRNAEQMIQVGFNGQHRLWWHWQVPAYIVTKDIAAGLFILMCLLAFDGAANLSPLFQLVSSATVVAFLIVTTLLLVFDLEKPERFLSIVFRPQWKSWLARGAFLLIGFSTLAGVVLLLDAAAYFGVLPATVPAGLRNLLLLIGTPLAVVTSVYTAWLFAQAEGRDLWQSPALTMQFFIRTFVAGFAAAVILAVLLAPAIVRPLAVGLSLSIVADFLMVWFCEVRAVHATEVAAQGAKQMTRGPYRRHFWIGGILIGHGLAVIAAFAGGMIVPACALAAVVGLFFREYAFVMAAQRVPNS